MKLYICGNGFDLHHSLKTRYSDYKEFLVKQYPSFVIDYENFPRLSEDECPWSNVEEYLNIDYEVLLYEAVENYYPDISSDTDSRWTDITVDVDVKTKFFFMFTGECFFNWISRLNYSNIKADNELLLSQDDMYVNFNYTDTIQRLYSVPDSQVLHIHGALSQIDVDALIMNNKPSINSLRTDRSNSIVRQDKHNSEIIRKIIQFGASGISLEKVHETLNNKYQDDDFFGASIEPAINTLDTIVKVTTKNLRQNFDKLGGLFRRPQ